MNKCPLCGATCTVRYREVPYGQAAKFVCPTCIEVMGLPPGGYSRKNAVAVAHLVARGLHPVNKERLN